ncbi:hypothetical protein UUU_27210 [Klebsiella pneumoniae subsp. pneumoniae DSM 30104 = JCM 1662 = NBRC 14940]|nr:hypothetical protein UUU_27210 [Klebsiella pneumoniae subsp. pneumoniae DSM 30104 = JCM 1662 = NBRC 14940]
MVRAKHQMTTLIGLNNLSYPPQRTACQIEPGVYHLLNYRI